MSDNNICIAHGGDISEPNGATNRVTAFSKALDNEGFVVHLVVPTPNKRFPRDLGDIVIHKVPIKDRGVKSQIGRALLVSFEAKKIAKKENAILQIEHSTLAGFASLTGCSDFVLDMHDLSFEDTLYSDLPFSNAIKKFIYTMEKRAVTKASKIIVVSNPMKDFIIEEWNVPKEKIELIPNGYFEEKIKSLNLNEIKEANGTISLIGALHPKLDLDKIILVAKSFGASEICIIGDGSVRQKLMNKIQEQNLKNISILGSLPFRDAFELLAKSQVVILPEHNSLLTSVSCPVKLFDYAALGKAIVADNVAEMCKIFKNNNAALVSDPEDTQQFIENIRVLLEDRSLREEISFNAKRLVKDFTWDRQSEKIIKMYKNM